MTTIAIVEINETTQFSNLTSAQKAAFAAKGASYTVNRMPGSKQFGVKKLVQLLAAVDSTEAEVVAVVPEAVVIYLAILVDGAWQIIVPLHTKYSSYMVTPSTQITHNWLGFPVL